MGVRAHGDGGSKAREGEARPELRPSLAHFHVAFQLKDQNIRGPDPSARTTGSDPKVSPNVETCPELISVWGLQDRVPSVVTSHKC